MKKIAYLLSTIFLLTLSIQSSAQELSSKETVLQKMELANNYFITKWPDPTAPSITDRERPSNYWFRATYHEGLMALYRLNNDQDLYDYNVDWGTFHNWAPVWGNLNTRNGDDQCCGQTYIELYQISGNADWIAPITTCMDNMADDNDNDDWHWIDAIQMAMPVFAKLGVVHEDSKYFDKMYAMYSYSKNNHGTNGLYNPVDHLWWRDADFDPPATTPNGFDIYWSRGNGWVYAALVRVLDIIPEDEAHRAEYLQDFKDMSAALIPLQREDGFWNSSLEDPDHYGGKETSGTAFFVYGLAWGINNGYLDSATYYPAMVKGWEGMENDALHPDGFLGYVQSTGKQPSDGQPLSYDKPANFEDYGLGAFLLAGTEVYKLAANGTDTDGDGVYDDTDNCVSIANPDQDDMDLDGLGDVCDDDIDGDGYNNDVDNCSMIANDGQEDMDLDGLGDVCDDDVDGDGYNNDDDNCPELANADQVDFDQDGKGDLCDIDADGDGIPNDRDLCDETPSEERANSEGCSPSQIESIDAYLANSERLQSYPNPSGGIVHIRYTVLEAAEVNIQVINSRGQLYKNLLVENWRNPGTYSVDWNPKGSQEKAPAGIYFIRFNTNGEQHTSRIVIY